MRLKFAIASIFAAHVLVAQAGERFPILTPGQMTPGQTKLLQALLAGPRGDGDATPEVIILPPIK